MNLTRFDNNGLELIINTDNGESFATISGYARMSGKNKSTISRRLESVANFYVNNTQIQTNQGLQSVALIDESLISEWIIKDNPELAVQLLKAGVRIYLHGLAGFKYQCQEIKPKTALELAREQVKLLEQVEELKLLNQSLEKENEQLSEAVDDLFNYSSIIRVAKFNRCSEKNFNWRKLKSISQQMKLEIKEVPCPRFETKKLYHHDVWRYAYPDFSLPETTTLVINR